MPKRQKLFTLTERQGQILRFIAENDPTTIYGISRAKGLHQHYANVYHIVEKLSKQNMLFSQRRGKIRYWWITPAGLIRAIDFGAEAGRIMDKARRVLKPDEAVELAGICKFALAHREDWQEQSSREILLWRYVKIAEPVLREIERERKAGHPFAVVTFDTERERACAWQAEKDSRVV